MKKIIVLLILILLITGCNKNEENKEKEIPKNNPIEVIDTYKDENPVKIAFYEGNKVLKEYQTELQNMTDINVFGVILTNEEEVIDTSFKYQFKKYYDEISEKEKYKIGYYIKFYTGDTLHEKTITDPSNTFVFAPYIYIYLYDDLHQSDGAWYSHVEEKDFNDKTLFTSTKLFMADKSKDITSSITLEAFTYDSEDDFDDNGNYRGNSRYSIEIKTA